MQLICPQFCLPFYGWQNDQDKEVYIIIKAKNEFPGPQLTVLHQAKLKDHFRVTSTVSLCCNMLRETKRLPLPIKEKQWPPETLIHKSLIILAWLISLAKSQRFTTSAAPNGLPYVRSCDMGF